MSHDDASGLISYNHNNDSVDITWDRVGFEKNFQIVNNAMEKATKGLKGTFVKNPTWTDALGKSVVSAHPLGGCPMGESGRDAVVNHAGQVFDGKQYMKISVQSPHCTYSCFSAHIFHNLLSMFGPMVGRLVEDLVTIS